MRWIELPNEKHRKIENIVIKSFSHDTLGSIGHKILPVRGNQKNTFDLFYQFCREPVLVGIVWAGWFHL